MSDLPTIDIHKYDGSYKGKFTVESFCCNAKDDMFNELGGRVSVTARRVIEEIHSDMGQPPNYNKSDGVYADDLLASVCWRLRQLDDDTDMIDLIDEQLCDLVRTNGWCPQGRCTRIWQILNCMI